MSRDSASVVIIGAGIVGSSIAYHLSARGCTNVIVLEKGDPEATGSTARCAAGVRHQFATEVNICLSLYSIERLKHFEEEVGGFSGLKQIGYRRYEKTCARPRRKFRRPVFRHMLLCHCCRMARVCAGDIAELILAVRRRVENVEGW